MDTELWAKGKAFRSLSVVPSRVSTIVSVRLSHGNAGMDVEESSRRFGLHEEILILSGYGHENWYWDLPTTEAKKKLQQFRSRALAAGFKKLGRTTIVGI